MRPAGRPFAWARTAHRISPDLKPCYALTSKKAEHCVDRFAVSWIRCAKLIAILQCLCLCVVVRSLTVPVGHESLLYFFWVRGLWEGRGG